MTFVLKSEPESKMTTCSLSPLHALVLGIESPFILTPSQIRHADSGNHSSIQLVGGKRARTTQHHARHAGLRKGMPQRPSFTLIHYLRRSESALRPLEAAQCSIGR